jgi:hypothetical protein
LNRIAEGPQSGRHLPRDALLGLLAGLTSAVLYISGNMGAAAGAGLAALAPLPLFMAALGWGLTPGAVAALSACIFAAAAMAFAGNLEISLPFVLAFALPSLLLARLAMLRRPPGQADAAAPPEWYPLNRLLLWMVGLAIGGFLAGELVAVLATGKGLHALFEPYIDQMVPEEVRQRLTAAEPGKLDWPTVRHIFAGVVPSGLGMAWQFIMIANLSAAVAILGRAQKLLRPPLGWNKLVLPRMLAPALLVCLLLAFALPGASYWTGTAAMQLFVPYFFLGLTVLHAIPVVGPGRIMLLGLFYFLIFQGAGIFVALLGLGEQWFGLRARLSARARRED